jgi:hypothetical protein
MNFCVLLGMWVKKEKAPEVRGIYFKQRYV